MTRLSLALAIALLTAPLAAGPRLKVHVSQAKTAEILVQAVVQPDAANRALEVVAESESLYRSSMVRLNGEEGPSFSSISFGQLPAALYDIQVRVLASDGKELARANDALYVQ
jgi:hypothetical protein